MRRTFTIASTAIISSAVTSAFWLVAFNTGDGPADASVVSAAPAAVVVAPKVDRRTPRVEVGPSGLAVPVAGVRIADLVDTYKQARADGARIHNAIDIMAPSGTPVVAASAGTVEKMYFSKGGGGITAYVRSGDGRWMHYYAHLQDYAPGLREGMRVQRGQRLGSVGYTGNANPAGPHLHYAVHRMQAGEDFWGGAAVNPYPLLVGR